MPRSDINISCSDVLNVAHVVYQNTFLLRKYFTKHKIYWTNIIMTKWTNNLIPINDYFYLTKNYTHLRILLDGLPLRFSIYIIAWGSYLDDNHNDVIVKYLPLAFSIPSIPCFSFLDNKCYDIIVKTRSAKQLLNEIFYWAE